MMAALWLFLTPWLFVATVCILANVIEAVLD